MVNRRVLRAFHNGAAVVVGAVTGLQACSARSAKMIIAVLFFCGPISLETAFPMRQMQDANSYLLTAAVV